MADVFDVAKYILEKQGSMTTMKLQKLVYYSQAWSIVWDEKPIFAERIEAWASGPVVRELWKDCDSDTILIKVEPTGPVCHTGNKTCFFEQLTKQDV